MGICINTGQLGTQLDGTEPEGCVRHVKSVHSLRMKHLNTNVPAAQKGISGFDYTGLFSTC